MQLEPISWERLTEALAERIAETKAADGGLRLRVAVDGPPAAGPGALAARVGDALRVRGREALVLDTGGFLRAASLRYEFGREDPDAYYDIWLDTGALWREVFGPLEPGGDGRVLPDLWDPATDRATRSPYVRLPPGGVVLLHGPLLLGRWFPFDFVVHLRLSAAALARRTPEQERWTLPAFARYEEEADPAASADVLVRLDDPRRPAWRPERP
ncbi:uridine kinase [Streptomyces sp. CNQ-509]|uniref:uridine kinase n=1 Tax=Streptomyces sp. CNQ-509 TaxID=444103 RepID=UPI00062DCD85|nr:uridine kinase [Streptomyces sp. CNQ-509]AKH81804.1 uridine kinase [Streptomyces sp. CNQ-509]